MIRLHVPQPLSAGAAVLPTLDQSRYLTQVMRLKAGDALLTIAVVLGLFIVHGTEIWMYAALYKAIGAVPDLREAVYFSSISYGSIGYDDSLMAPQWRLLGAIEGVAGAILLGWSVAFFVSVMMPFTARRKHGMVHRDLP